jgi:hypothetical protein
MRVECFRPPGHPSVLEINVRDPLPNVPTWIWVNTERLSQPFKTTPIDHHFAQADGRYGFPHDLLLIAMKYVCGEKDGITTETETLEVLAGWSRDSS